MSLALGDFSHILYTIQVHIHKMEADHSTECSESANVATHCSVAEAMKLISHPFDGDKKSYVNS